MRYLLPLLLLFVLSCKKDTAASSNVQLQSGDIIFQTSTSAQSKAIQLATKSKYSHCGIIYQLGDEYYVYEAIQPVTRTPLQNWISRGKNAHYVVKRLKYSSAINPDVMNKMGAVGRKMSGKNYDLYFEWSNDRIYCSELVWKIYNEGAGIEIGKLERLKDFDLSHPEVQKIMKQRYGNSIPVDEKVISPVAIFNSDKLYTVYSNYP